MERLFAGESILPIIFVTGVLGGGAAWLSGRAIARAWRPPWQVAVATLLLGAAARFIHFALFQGELLSVASYGCDALIFLIVGLLAWRTTRASQMVRQYPWLYARSGPLSWREIVQENERGRC
ncbi:MAG TPA: hypothetical protein VK430_09815 [Xanthobacteraceae bacterium]|nr:hypothetical protein [Xanthobacteraceae bacterium]